MCPILSIKPSCIVSIWSVCVCVYNIQYFLGSASLLLLFRRVPGGRGGKKCEINSEERIALWQIHSPHCRPCAESAGGSAKGLSSKWRKDVLQISCACPPPIHEGCVPQRPASSVFLAMPREGVCREDLSQQWQKKSLRTAQRKLLINPTACYSKTAQQGKQFKLSLALL